MNKSLRVAFLLGGCGSKDGSEITEAVSLIIQMSKRNYDVEFFAPDRNQHHVINHLTSLEEPNSIRNILSESARICRGNALPISQLDSKNFDALVISGGFGIAKNLCDFAFNKSEPFIYPDIENVLIDFYKNKKIIAAMCIAPILISLFSLKFNLSDVQITFGDIHNEAAQFSKNICNITPIKKEVNESCIDIKNRFVSTPAYMHSNATAADIFSGVESFCLGIEELMK